MRSDTKSISIKAAPDQVWKFVADPENLPRWAVGFAKAIRKEDGKWIVTTGEGVMGVRIEADAPTRTVDFHLSPAPGIDSLAASRVVRNGSGSEYVFTQFQTPGMPDELFDKNVRALEHELAVLRAVLEVECPL